MDPRLRSSPWIPVTATGEVPGPRTKLTAVPWRDKMIVFGGGFRRDFCDGLFEFSFDTREFRRIPACDSAPSARRSHSCVVHRDKLLVFGGRVKAGRLNDLHELDLVTRQWRVLHPPSAALQAALRESSGAVDVEGVVQSCPYLETNAPRPALDTVEDLLRAIPCERAAHSATLYNNSQMIVFGGNSSLYDLFLDDLHCWDSDRLRWSRLEPTTPSRPKGRLGHSAVVKGRAMYVFGGYGGEALNDLWVFHFPTMQWREISFAFPVNPSSFHAAVVYNNHMIVYGGSFGNQVNDLNPPHMYTLDLRTERWAIADQAPGAGPSPEPSQGAVVAPTRAPTGRLGHALLVHRYDLYLYAGSDQTYYNDLFVAHLAPPSLLSFACEFIARHRAAFRLEAPEEEEEGVVPPPHARSPAVGLPEAPAPDPSGLTPAS